MDLRADSVGGFVRTNGSYPLRFLTNNTERMRIDSSGNVGIGITPTAKLHLGGTNPSLVFGTSGNELTYLQRYNDDFYIFNKETTGRMLFGTANSEAMRIDSSGNVGIGTSSPSDKLHVEGDIRVNNAIESAGNLNLEAENGSMRFQTGSGSPTEAMRIDSSGNLLVGTTTILTAENNVEGISLAAGSYGGLLSVSRDGGRSATFNRSTSDGDIVQFRKDGATVGSISSRGGVATNLILRTATGQGAGIGGANSGVLPCDEDGLQDAEINLGASGTRWKDLYLSNSAYVGDKIIHDGDTDTYMQFNGANSWRVVTGNSERLVVNNSQVTIKNGLTVSDGDITLSGTGRIQGVDTVSSGTDAANKNYVDTAVASAGGDEQTATTTSTSQTAIATYTASSSLGLEITVIATNTVTTERTISKLLVTHDNTTAVATEYGTVNTDTTIATFDVDISGGNVRLLATAASSNSTNYTAKAVILA
jgi:hypothetical protein